MDINERSTISCEITFAFPGTVPEIRFYWMRRTTGAVRSAPGVRVTPGGMIELIKEENMTP